MILYHTLSEILDFGIKAENIRIAASNNTVSYNTQVEELKRRIMELEAENMNLKKDLDFYIHWCKIRE